MPRETYQIKFKPGQLEALERMAEDLNTTKADVIRRALGLLEVAIRELKQGRQITVSKDGEILKELTGIL